MTYVPLHVHDTFGSIGDSILKIPDYVSKVEEYGCTAAAITNHGSLSTFVSFYEECNANDIKPIIGCEFYFVEDRFNKEDKIRAHIILLAKNYNGLKNLIQLHNDSQENGFYYKPRVDFESIEKYKDDLICLSACVSSPMGKEIKQGNTEKAINFIEKFLELFKEDFFLEIQPGRFKEQLVYNDFLVAASREYGIKLVATNDIHYLDQEEAEAHNYHVSDCRKYEVDNDKFIYPDTVYYLMKEDELYRSFIRTSIVTDNVIREAVENTNLVAEMCNIILPEEKIMPVFDVSIDEAAELSRLCREKLSSLPVYEEGNTREEYTKRLNKELETINTLGFAGYFLIVKDIIDYCDKNKIARGPGRGSCAGSLVSYLLGISVADPIKYGLMFERFLSVKRAAMPDIDLDLCISRKSEVYEYIISKYGKDHCCYVSTFNMRKARNAVKTACRLLKISTAEANEISTSIPMVYYDEAGEKITNVSVEKAYNTFADFHIKCDDNPGLLELSKKLEGYPSSMGIHPAGIIISPVKITDRYPLIKVKDTETKEYKSIMATSLDLKDVEKLSGVKFDLLSLSSLDVIHKTMEMARAKFDFNDDAIYKEEKVWRLISSEYNAGLFQISSDTYKNRMPELHPKTIQELAACLALIRGPCISSGMDKTYIDIINGRREEEKIHDVYWQATKDTHGVLIYQEQILKICINIGFDAETAYDILKAVSKKKIEKIKSYEKSFYELGQKKGIEENTLDTIWQRIKDSGLYAFNVSHAVSYALVCYQSAWLKYHYPLEYMCNLLTKEADNPTKINNIIRECKTFGAVFLPLDINKSSWEFTIEEGKIRIGFCAVKGIGESVYEKIREAGEIKSFSDFLERVAGRVVNKKAILILISVGTFNELEENASGDLAKKYMLNIRKEKDWDGKINIGSRIFVKNNSTKSDVYRTVLGSALYA